MKVCATQGSLTYIKGFVNLNLHIYHEHCYIYLIALYTMAMLMLKMKAWINKIFDEWNWSPQTPPFFPLPTPNLPWQSHHPHPRHCTLDRPHQQACTCSQNRFSGAGARPPAERCGGGGEEKEGGRPNPNSWKEWSHVSSSFCIRLYSAFVLLCV